MRVRKFRQVTRKFIALGLLIAPVAASLTGCGGSSEPVASSTPTPPPTSSGPPPETAMAPGGSEGASSGSSAPSGAPSSAGHDEGGSASSSGNSGNSGGDNFNSGGVSSGGNSGDNFNSGGVSSGGNSGDNFNSGGYAGDNFNSGGAAPSSGGHDAGGGVSSGGYSGPGMGEVSASPGGGGHSAGGSGANSGGANSSGSSPYGAGYDSTFGGSSANSGGTSGYPGPGAMGAPGGLPTGGAGGLGNLLNVNPSQLLGTLATIKPAEIQRFPKDYGTQAELAFKQGYEDLATKLYLAHLATEPNDAKAAYDRVQFSTALRRPTWHLRWAISIGVRTPDGYAGGLSPITNETSSSGSGGGSGSSDFGASSGPGGAGIGGVGLPPGLGGGPGGGSGGAQGSGEALAGGTSLSDIPRAIGLFADVTRDNFNKRFAAGSFGSAFSQFAGKVSQPAAQEGNRPAAGGGVAASGPGTPPIPAGYPGMGNLTPPMPAGYPGQSEGEGGSSAMPQGYPGMPGGYPGMPGGAQPAAAAPDSFLVSELPIAHPQWQPGIVYLGEMTYQDAIKEAQRAGIDYLIHFDVRIDQRKDEVVNETQARLISVDNSRTPLVASKKLSNLDVKKRRGDGARSAVEDAMETIFEKIDRELVLKEMPRLTSERAQRRIGDLIADNSGNEIRSLTEVMLYKHWGLINDEDVIVIAEMLFGDEALRLLAGSPGVRREAADGLQKHLTSYGEIGMLDPSKAALAGANQNGAGGFPGGSGYPGMPGGYPGGGNSGGGINPNAPSLAPDSSGGANSGGGGGSVSPPGISDL